MPTQAYNAFEDAEKKYGRYFCRRCVGSGKVIPASERYSMGIYAGMYCESCWASDGRNHDREFDPMDAGEAYEADEY